MAPGPRNSVTAGFVLDAILSKGDLSLDSKKSTVKSATKSTKDIGAKRIEVGLTVIRWRIALAGWMGLIFLMSSRWMVFGMSADATEAWFGVLNYAVRKLAHLTEYAILTYLWLRSVWTAGRRFGPCLAWSAALSVCYAVTDEIHQNSVPERLGTWTDVLYDGAGILLMVYLLWKIRNGENASLKHRMLGIPVRAAGS